MLVIFDVDGTLVDSQNLIVEAQAETFRRLGLTPPAREKTLSLVGLSLVPTFQALVGEDGPVDELVAHYRDVFSTIIATPGRKEPLYPGVPEMIAALHATPGLMLAVATGKSRRGMARVFDHYGWHGVFASVQTADTNASKPDPEMILNALSDTGADASDAIFIGDTSFDMEMGRAAHVESWGVSWGYHSVATLRAAGAAKILTTTEDALSEIKARFKTLSAEPIS